MNLAILSHGGHRCRAERAARMFLATGSCLLMLASSTRRSSAGPESAGTRVGVGLSGTEYHPSLRPDGSGHVLAGFSRDGALHHAVKLTAEGVPVEGWSQAPAPGLNFVTSFPRYATCIAPAGQGGVWLISDAASGGVQFYQMLSSEGLFVPQPQGTSARPYTGNVAVVGSAGHTLVFGRGLGTSINSALLDSSGVVQQDMTSVTLRGSCLPFFDPTPVADSDGEGGAYVVAQVSDFTDGSGDDLVVMRFGPDAAPAWSPASRALSAAARDQFDPALCPDGEGGAYLVWTDARNAANGDDLYFQHLLADGSVAPGNLAASKAVASGSGRQFQGRIAPDDAGGCWVVWTDSRSGSNDIYYTHLGPTGSPLPGYPAGGNALCAAPGGQVEPQLSADGNGGIFVVWLDQRDGELDLYGQHLHATGVVMPGWALEGEPLCTNPHAPSSPLLATVEPGRAVAAWVDGRDGEPHLFASGLPADGSILGVSPVASRGISLSATGSPGRRTPGLRLTATSEGEVRVSLSDVQGRQLALARLWGPLLAEPVEFAGLELPPGLYFAAADQAGARTSLRLIVLR